MWHFPEIDPVAFRAGPLEVRWYGLMYLFGLLGGYFLMRRLARKRRVELSGDALLDLVGCVAVGVVAGGRLGYVLFYNLPFYLHNPLEIFAVWRGGMSFHGGLLGSLFMGWRFARKRRIPFYALSDLGAVAAPIGLGLGRIGNFINGELYGRPSDAPWAMVFPQGGPLPRHPSELYEALLEGLLLFFALLWLSGRVEAEGALTWAFIGGYGLARFVVEFFREPDPQLGLVAGPFSMGQILSFVMVLSSVVYFTLEEIKKQKTRP